MKKGLYNLTISFLVLILLLFVTDYLLGLIYDEKPKEYIPQRHIYLRERSPHEVHIYQQSLGYFMRDTTEKRTRELRFVVDEKGFIEPSNLLENPDLSIAFLGGSTTECAAVADLKRFPYLVGEQLNQRGFKVNTMNAGVSANTSAHTLNIYLNKVLPEEPDIAVMMHNINDLNHLLRAKDYWHRNGSPTHIITPEARSLKTALIVNIKSVFPNIGLRFDNVLYNLRSKSPSDGKVDKIPLQSEEDKANVFRKFRENLELFISISRIKGITPVLMTQGSRIMTDYEGIEEKGKVIQSRIEMSLDEYKVLYAKMNQIIRNICEEQNVLLVDLDEVVLPEHIYDAIHYNDTGSEFVAGKITQELIPLVEEMILDVSNQ